MPPQPKPSQRIAARALARSAHFSNKHQPSLDTTLQRLASLSQVGVLLLAVFGYFYTVLPFYKLAVTEEELSRKSLELVAAEQKIEAAGVKLESFRAEAQKSVDSARQQTKEYMVLAVIHKDCAPVRLLQVEPLTETCIQNSIRALAAADNGATLTTFDVEYFTQKHKTLPQRLASASSPYQFWLAELRAIRNPF